MQEKQTIKACPCCGGEAVLTALMNSSGRSTAWIRCNQCGTSSEMYDSIDEAVKAWNRRYYTAPEAVGEYLRANRAEVSQ